VPKQTMAVCVLTPGAHSKPHPPLREYGVTTRQLLEFAAGLWQKQVTHLGMASTGVYGKPIWNILEAAGFTLTLAHAPHGKNVPGQKTDTADCAWLAQLLRHGWLPGSFVPEASLRQLRDLRRARVSLVRERAALANCLQKTRADANSQLGNLVSDRRGVSSRARRQSFVEGETAAARFAALARGRMPSKPRELTAALEGKVSGHHRFLGREYRDQVEYLERKIAVLEEEIGRHRDPFVLAIDRLDPVPGCHPVSRRARWAEIGTDREQFPTAKHLCRWAGVCPGKQESAGRGKSGRTRQGHRWWRGRLKPMAWAAAHTKDTYFWAQCRRLRRPRGEKRALWAGAHSLLTVSGHRLKHGTAYRKGGPDYFDRIEPQRLERPAVSRLQRLGFPVILQQKTASRRFPDRDFPEKIGFGGAGQAS
jgi:transposase